MKKFVLYSVTLGLLLVLTGTVLTSCNESRDARAEEVAEMPSADTVAADIVNHIRDCSESHTLLAFFEDGTMAEMNLPPWGVIAVMAQSVEPDPVKAQSMIVDELSSVIDEMIHAGAVGFQLVGSMKDPSKEA